MMGKCREGNSASGTKRGKKEKMNRGVNFMSGKRGRDLVFPNVRIPFKNKRIQF